MTTPVAARPNLEWTGRWAMRLLVLLHVPTVWLGPFFTSVGGIIAPGPGWGLVPVLLGVPLHALLLTLSLARARGTVLRFGPVIVVVIAGLSFVPMAWFGFDPWAPTLSVVSAALLLTFRGWLGHALLVVPIGALAWRILGSWSVETSQTWIDAGYLGLTVFTGYLIAPYTLFGAAYLVAALDRLRSIRAELTELAVARERLRLSRDLHDLLGQSLSAISLKGDVALGLVDDELPEARGEIAELATIARQAVTGAGDITQDAHLVSLRTELASATTLLRAGRIELIAPEAPTHLPAAVDAVLAWSLREGVTNALRHSLARRVDVELVVADGTVRLDVVNDGIDSSAPGRIDEGNGLRGLAGRAAELGGTVSAGKVEDDRFRLRVELPC